MSSLLPLLLFLTEYNSPAYEGQRLGGIRPGLWSYLPE